MATTTTFHINFQHYMTVTFIFASKYS